MGDEAYTDMRYQQLGDEDLGVDMGGVDDSFEPIPEGQYAIQAISQELKPTKDGLGQFVAVTFQVTDGPFANRQIFENFNVRNQNQQTVDIALRAIKGWIKATGGTGEERLTMGLIRSMEGREFLAQVYIEAARGQWDAKNRLRFSKCKPLGYQVDQPQNTGGQAATGHQQTASGHAHHQATNTQAHHQPSTAQASTAQHQSPGPNLAGQPAKRPWER